MESASSCTRAIAIARVAESETALSACGSRHDLSQCWWPGPPPGGDEDTRTTHQLNTVLERTGTPRPHTHAKKRHGGRERVKARCQQLQRPSWPHRAPASPSTIAEPLVPKRASQSRSRAACTHAAAREPPSLPPRRQRHPPAVAAALPPPALPPRSDTPTTAAPFQPPPDATQHAPQRPSDAERAARNAPGRFSRS